MSASDRADVYSRITAEIVSAIENGAGEWRMPWHHDGDSVARPRNVTSDKGYRGVNILALWAAARRGGYTSGIWGTYQQWSLLGGQVRKGEKATTIVFWKRIANGNHGDDADDGERFEHGEREGRSRFFARGYQVFNASQVDGYIPADWPRLPESERIARADAFFTALDIPIITCGDQACYRPDIDTVFMPPFERFIDGASYYSCLGHETGHDADRQIMPRWSPESGELCAFPARHVGIIRASRGTRGPGRRVDIVQASPPAPSLAPALVL